MHEHAVSSPQRIASFVGIDALARSGPGIHGLGVWCTPRANAGAPPPPSHAPSSPAAPQAGTDEGILPALYMFVGRSLHATLPQLGALTMCRAVMQARPGRARVCGEGMAWRAFRDDGPTDAGCRAWSWLGLDVEARDVQRKARPWHGSRFERRPVAQPPPPPAASFQAASSPISGMLGDRHDRTIIVATGCAIWGVRACVHPCVRACVRAGCRSGEPRLCHASPSLLGHFFGCARAWRHSSSLSNPFPVPHPHQR